MSVINTTEFDVATHNFLDSHRHCPVEITIRDLDCHFAADSGMLRRIELVTEPNGSVQLNIVLRRGDRSCSVKTIRHIRAIHVTGRRLSVDAGRGIHEDLECLAPHNARGREKLLLIRHLAVIAQA